MTDVEEKPLGEEAGSIDLQGEALRNDVFLGTHQNMQVRDFFNKAVRSFGNTALCLSGGAAMGYYHFGVVQALFEEGTTIYHIPQHPTTHIYLGRVSASNHFGHFGRGSGCSLSLCANRRRDSGEYDS